MYVFMVEQRDDGRDAYGQSVESTVVMHVASTMDRAVSWMEREARLHPPDRQIGEDIINGRVSWYAVIREMVDDTAEVPGVDYQGEFDLYGKKLDQRPQLPPWGGVPTMKPMDSTQVNVQVQDLRPLCQCPCHTTQGSMMHFTACCGPGMACRPPYILGAHQ